jgi:hypothetical protein
LIVSTQLIRKYGAVRALYTSMVLDAERWGLFGVDGGHMATAAATHDGGDGSSVGGQP